MITVAAPTAKQLEKAIHESSHYTVAMVITSLIMT